MALIVESGTVPKSDGYGKALKRRKYWRMSYECYGADYVTGVDGEGIPILRQHEREKDEDFTRRKQTATPWCFVSPILRKYNSFVFRKPFTYDKDVFSDLAADVDGNGTLMSEFMRARTLEAQIDAVNYILLDSVNSTGKETTVAHAQETGERIVWKAVNADQIIQSRWFEGSLVEAAILMCDIDGNDFIWYVTPTTVQVIAVTVEGSDINVTGAGPETPHNWGGTPLVPVLPDFGTVSQAAPIAELQKAVTRERSLLDEEIWNNTYTLLWGSGISAENMKDVEYGPKRMLCFPEPTSTLNAIGGDVNQAASIRTSIEDNVKEIERVSGVAGTGDQAAESGVAKSFRFNDLATNLAALSKAASNAHKRCEKLTAHAKGVTDYETVVYPTDFTMPILQTELNEVASAMISSLPRLLKDKMVSRFAERNFELSDEETALLKTQMEEGGVLPSLLENQAARMGS